MGTPPKIVCASVCVCHFSCIFVVRVKSLYHSVGKVTVNTRNSLPFLITDKMCYFWRKVTKSFQIVVRGVVVLFWALP